MDSESKAPLIILFDGTCGMCDATVQFLLKRDPTRRFQFCALQTQTARDLLTQHALDADQIQSIVLIEADRVYTKSSAVLRIVLEMPEPWPLLATLVFIPQRMRDDAYDFIARHRHQWFKPPNACPTPNDQDREQFLA